MAVQEVQLDNGEVGWRWGDDGVIYTGPYGKRMALREGANIDPRAFASLQGQYEVVVAGEDVSWDIPMSKSDQVIHLD